jgi:hypothetical protein
MATAPDNSFKPPEPSSEIDVTPESVRQKPNEHHAHEHSGSAEQQVDDPIAESIPICSGLPVSLSVRLFAYLCDLTVATLLYFLTCFCFGLLIGWGVIQWTPTDEDYSLMFWPVWFSYLAILILRLT